MRELARTRIADLLNAEYGQVYPTIEKTACDE